MNLYGLDFLQLQWERLQSRGITRVPFAQLEASTREKLLKLCLQVNSFLHRVSSGESLTQNNFSTAAVACRNSNEKVESILLDSSK